VIPTNPIFVVNPIFPGQKKTYFFNGDILDPNRTFHDYRILNGDGIVTVPIEQMNLNAEIFWKKATKNSFKIKDRSNEIHDQITKRLFAKKIMI
jgi:hypothetical protein